MDLTIDELRDAAITAIRGRFAPTKLVVTPVIGALVTDPAQTAFARIEVTDEDLIANKDRIARFMADRCDAAEISVTGHCRV